jgi:heterodisulfide reductase subunit A-like polyferredoxin
MDALPIDERINSFDEVVAGYSDEKAQAEAARCLACGICSECLSCQYNCGVNAIDHDMVAITEEIDIGAVVLAPGYQAYHAELSEEFGFGRYPNVVTALQFERLLSASGPTMGHVERPSDGEIPQNIAFLQCIGSRDQTHDYCSAVCCMYATKEAIIAKEHHPDLDIQVFMMDMRAFSKGYQGYFDRAKDKYGVKYTRCRISAIQEDPSTNNLILHYSDESAILSGKESLSKDEFDMVVLSIGMEISDSIRDLGHRLGIMLDEYGFCHTTQFNPIESSRPGIYAVGPFREPKDIPESVVEASAAAASSAGLLSDSRWSNTQERKYPPEKDFSNDPPRIGVFVCHCGSNIGGFLDVPEVARYASALPNVVHAEDNLYSCSQDSIKQISERVETHNFNRVVVASCSPLTHAPLFQDSIRSAGLNPYVFEMANIRNQCSWVHSDNRDVATEKAKQLVGMAVARATLLEPQYTVDIPVQNSALVVGGGVAGLSTAISLADQNYPVHLIEKEGILGGNTRNVYTSMAENTRHPQDVLHELIENVSNNDLIITHLNSEVIQSSGFMGNFSSVIKSNNGTCTEISHGVTVLATGAQEYRGSEYGYGKHSRIITQQELERLIYSKDEEIQDEEESINLKSVVMIQCVGPAEQFCSRICCTVALKNALTLKEIDPEIKITILYKDIRTYGFKEKLYTRAREAGVIFIHYDDNFKPQVKICELGSEVNSKPEEPTSLKNTEIHKGILVEVRDTTLNREFTLKPDLLILSMPVVPNPDVHHLANLFKVAIDTDGFFQEAHVKLKPVDFSSNGVFMAGMAHYPKFIDESMIQAQAAAARAGRILSQKTLKAGGQVAVVDEGLCTGCLTCVRACPFGVPQISANLTGIGNIMGAAYIESAVCQGCGSCAAECPAHAIQLMHYTDAQMSQKIKILLDPTAELINSQGVKKGLHNE